MLKKLPFTLPDDRKEIFEKIEKFYNGEDNTYKKIISYYKKYWLTNEYINYSELIIKNYLIGRIIT